MPSLIDDALFWLDRAEQAREVAQKTQKTPRRELELARQRAKEVT